MALLRDPANLGGQSMVVPPQVLMFLSQLQGEETLPEIFERIQVPAEAHDQLEQMVVKMDELGYFWGPTADALERAKLEEIRTAGKFSLGEDQRKPEIATQLREFMQASLAETEDPELGAAVAGIVAPHLDYGRGKPNYAAAYKCFETGAKDRPDRVVVLGTNHMGIGDGVVMTEFGFETPLGDVKQDGAILERLRDAFGEKLFKDQLDFLGEHSVALHLPWIQHLYGDTPVIAALVPDPTRDLLADDGQRVSTPEFANALKDIVKQAGGRTLFVSSADLSHKGPQFGDKTAIDTKARHTIEQYDRETLAAWLDGPEEFLKSFKSSGNPNRWCSVGNLYATLVATPHRTREMVNYAQSVDDKGIVLVSSAALALLAD
ncbi:MAG: AmmeMemoRadiSam system protein B [Phycisphaerae bacterium]|nr:AmmeMemoRadiSam system protein B [Phycisphaerae bacterium]